MKKEGYAIVTGGARGMGAAICRQLAKEGYDVVCNYVSESSAAKVAALAEEIKNLYGTEVVPAHGDVSKYEDCKSVVEIAVSKLGRNIAVLVNNAGITVRKTLVECTLEDYTKVINTNLMAVLHMTHCVLPYMYERHGGCIVNISSVGGIMGVAGQSHYSAAKAGVIGLTKALAKEVGPEGIRVNSVAPGFIITDMTLANKAAFENYRQASPIRKLGEPEDIADCVSYIVNAGFLTGQTISPNGGITI